MDPASESGNDGMGMQSKEEEGYRSWCVIQASSRLRLVVKTVCVTPIFEPHAVLALERQVLEYLRESSRNPPLAPWLRFPMSTSNVSTGRGKW